MDLGQFLRMRGGRLDECEAKVRKLVENVSVLMFDFVHSPVEKLCVPQFGHKKKAKAHKDVAKFIQ